jgi:hypothetical protein
MNQIGDGILRGVVAVMTYGTGLFKFDSDIKAYIGDTSGRHNLLVGITCFEKKKKPAGEKTESPLNLFD